MRISTHLAAWVFAIVLVISGQRAGAQSVTDQEQGTLEFTNVTTPINHAYMLVFQPVFSEPGTQDLLYIATLGDIPTGNSTETGIYNPAVGMGSFAQGIMIVGQHGSGDAAGVSFGVGNTETTTLAGQPYSTLFTSTPVSEATLLADLNTSHYAGEPSAFQDLVGAIDISNVEIPLSSLDGNGTGQFVNFSTGTGNGTIGFTDDGAIDPSQTLPGSWSNVPTGNNGGGGGNAVPLPSAAWQALAMFTGFGLLGWVRKATRRS